MIYTSLYMYLRILTLTLVLFLTGNVFGQSWAQAVQDKHADLELIWYTSTPFVFPDASGNLNGLEYEIFLAFQEFVKEKYNVDLKLNWKEGTSFTGIMDSIRLSEKPNVFGVSAFSITKERQKHLKFTKSYLPDITVLVSSQGTPIVRTFDEIHDLMGDMKAITIRGTVYEDFLNDIKSQLGVDFNMEYITSDQNVLDVISRTPDSFGFIDMLIYMIWMKNGTTLTRQNFFTVRGIGYGFVLPLDSDWDEPFAEFFEDEMYQERVGAIITKFVGPELYEFIDNLYEGEPLGTSILTKEKEIQLALVENTNLKLEQEQAYKKMLVYGMAASSFFLLVIGVMYFHNHRNTQLLIKQKDQIERQERDIRSKNEQLTNRNDKLITINEEKNKLVSMLAHDLRAPLSHIIGMNNLLGHSKSKMTSEEQEYLGHIMNAAKTMNDMVGKILDADAVKSNQTKVLLEPVSVDQLLNDVEVRYKLAAREKDISLQIVKNHTKDLIQTDHTLLLLILENLVSNAVKFSEMGTRIDLGSTDSEGEIIFTVRDQGPGFTEEDKEKMFDRFQKLSAKPTGNESSTGLGLSIVKKYVREIGGKINLASELGKGSTFFIHLPIR